MPAGAPVLVLSHDPDMFPRVPERVSLTLSGHTHGGQVALPFVRRPILPSCYGERYARGHVVEHGRHLVVGAGLGTSGLPLRLLAPPELLVLELLPGQGMRRLLTIPISHYCEKARWALERAALDYREERHVQGVNRIVSKRAGGHGTLPVLFCEAGTLLSPRRSCASPRPRRARAPAVRGRAPRRDRVLPTSSTPGSARTGGG